MKYFFIFIMLVNQFVLAKTFESSETKTELLELYTSESCSSCPPAESWLNTLKKSPGIWKNFIPLEFHVDYWNYLNWKDRFSQSLFSKRQRQYNKTIKAGVYTPQIIRDGKDWRAWRKNALKIKSNKAAPKLILKYHNNQSTIQLSKLNPSHNYLCLNAMIGGGFKTKVRSGENRGRSLIHEFVVLDLQEKDLSKTGRCQLRVRKNIYNGADKKYIAAWILDKTTNQIIQAVGGEI